MYHPTATQFTSVPDGLQTAYSNNGTLSQILTETFLGNTEYSLSVYVGRRADCPDLFPGYSVALYADNDLLASETFLAADRLANPAAPLPNPGEFVPVTVTYTSLVADPRHINIVLGSVAIQNNFDNVRLESRGISVVPEPSSGLLVVAGLVRAEILLYKRRRRGKTQ